MEKLISFGLDHFNPRMFHSVSNMVLSCGLIDPRNKPLDHTCFWASTYIEDDPEGYTSDWQMWCINNEFNIDKLKKWIIFTLNSNKILRIEDEDDYFHYIDIFNLAKKYPYYNELGVMTKNKIGFDYETIAKNYDAMHIGYDAVIDCKIFYGNPEIQEYLDLSSFDVESWIIFNPDIIHIIETHSHDKEE